MNTCLGKHTQGHWSTVGKSCDPWPGSHWALLVWGPTGTPVCVHTQQVLPWSCLCVSFLICGGSERRRAEGDRREERQQRKSKSEGERKREPQTRKYASFLFVSDRSPSRPRMVVSTMITERWSQSLASHKTVNRQSYETKHKKKNNGLEGALGSLSPVLCVCMSRF